MEKLVAAAVAVMCAASVGTIVLAQRREGVGSPSAPVAEVPPLLEATGTVRAVDAKEQIVTLVTASGQRRLKVDEATTVFVRGRLGGLDDLSTGQAVRATFEPGPDTPVAQWIEVD